MLKNKNILLISPEPWDHIFVSKHHYAVHLAKRGNKVFFLNPAGKPYSISSSGYAGVYEMNYPFFLTGLRILPKPVQRLLIRKTYERLQSVAKEKFDIVWSFDNSVFYDFEALPASVVKISHIVDFNQDFQFVKAVRTADVCFCSAEVIRQRMQPYNENVHKILHGFNECEPVAVTLPGSSKIKAVYSGNLAIPYIDWTILTDAIISQPHVDFVFIGPGKEDSSFSHHMELLQKSENVFFLGRVDPCLLQGYYQAADVLLLCYQSRYQSTQVTSPHKMMEYLGSGRVIVTTFTSDFAPFASLLAMTRANNEYVALLRDVLMNLDRYNSAALSAQRKAFASDNSYSRQVEKMSEILDGYMRANKE